MKKIEDRVKALEGKVNACDQSEEEFTEMSEELVVMLEEFLGKPIERDVLCPKVSREVAAELNAVLDEFLASRGGMPKPTA